MPNWCYNKVSITNNSDDNSKLQKSERVFIF